MDMIELADTEASEFLQGVVGAVEATGFEYHCLWKEARELEWSWEENLVGLWRQIGGFNDMPVCLSIRTAVVRGHKIAFYHPTSRIVDHEMVENWLRAVMPASALREGTSYLNKSDAMNFSNVFPRALSAKDETP